MILIIKKEKNMDIKLKFKLIYEDGTIQAEYSVKAFEDLLLNEWEKIKNAGDRKEVIKRAFQRACNEFNKNAVSIKNKRQ